MTLSPLPAARHPWSAGKLVDVHCHCLPGLDDGPKDLDASLDLCEALVDDGFSHVVATPHQLGRYEANDRARIDGAYKQLCTAVEAAGIPLTIHLGADVRIDDQLAERIERGQVITVADRRRHLLLELPHECFVEPLPLIETLAQRGITTIMTHPERYRYLAAALEPIEAWSDRGVVIQLTAGSLLGDFGRTAFAYAWRIVRAGLADLIATDAHDDRRRRPRMQDAIERLTFEVGEAEAERLCGTNPRRVLEGSPVQRP